MAIKRGASAVWKGDLKTGKGTISTQSGVLSATQYSFSTRFEEGTGTNPEELIGAAHAGCFSMALSAQLGNAGLTAESIETAASSRQTSVVSMVQPMPDNDGRGEGVLPGSCFPPARGRGN